MLLERYEPKRIDEIIGNKKQIEEIRAWLGQWRRGRALLLHGPPGMACRRGGGRISATASRGTSRLGCPIRLLHRGDSRSATLDLDVGRQQ